MKNSKLIVLAAAAFMFAACDEKTEGVTNLTLDQSTAQVEVGKTVTLTATVEPSGAAEVVWESSNTTVATVDEGVVTGVSEGTAIIAANAGGITASCIITVVAENSGSEDTDTGTTYESLQGSEYYPFFLDETTAEALGSKIIYDFRPDDMTKFLYIWENTYTSRDATGMGFYGNTDGYTSMTVTSTWSGCGLFVPAEDADALYEKIIANPEDYYFHMAIKSTDTYSHCFYLFGVESTSKFVIGSSSVYDGPVIMDFTRDGSWQEIEIPMSDIDISGYTPDSSGINIFVALTEGVSGAVLSIDAVFIYKK